MKFKFIENIKYWLQLFLIPVYWFSFITPRNKRIWVLGSTFGHRWADNARYFYLYLDQFEREKIRPIWISRDKKIVELLNQNGREAYYVRSLKGVFYCLSAKVYIFDNYSKDICFWLSGGAVKVNLWHGSGNKKTNFDNKFDFLRHPRSAWERISTTIIRMSNEKPNHYTLATSPMMEDIFVSAFRTSHDHIILEGYPRNTVLLDNTIKNIYNEIEIKNLNLLKKLKADGNMLLVYMPTFRASEVKFFEVMDLPKFNTFLKEENLIFLTKMHPKSKVRAAFEQLNYSNIVNVSAEVDPYTFLKEIDLLVTDYSSIYSDYLLLDRPSVLFPFDFEEYSNDTRECYFTYDEYMPEIKAYDMQELMDNIRLVLKEDTAKEERYQLRNRIFSCQDGDSSRRLYEKICKIIDLS